MAHQPIPDRKTQIMATWFTQMQTEDVRADIYNQGRKHAINGGSLLSEARLTKVRTMLKDQVLAAGFKLTPAQLETIIDGYAEGYSLGLDEYAQINDDTEGLTDAEFIARHA